MCMHGVHMVTHTCPHAPVLHRSLHTGREPLLAILLVILHRYTKYRCDAMDVIWDAYLQKHPDTSISKTLQQEVCMSGRCIWLWKICICCARSVIVVEDVFVVQDV